MFRLRLFGGASLTGPHGPVHGRALQQRRLATLALLAASSTGALGRDRIAGLLWSDKAPPRARHRLADTLHGLRKALGRDALRTAGAEVRLDPAVVGSDVADFEAALARRDPAGAVALYRGPFLDGFVVRGAPDFERWAEESRGRYERAAGEALEALASGAAAAGEARTAARWWRELVRLRPFEAGGVLGLMEALAAGGDRAGAVEEARSHGARLREALELEPDPAVEALAERLRAGGAAVWMGAAAPCARGTEGAPRPLGRPSPRCASPEARDHYLKARWLLESRTREGMLRAVDGFERAIAHDPGFAAAHAGLAEAYLMLGSANHGVIPPADALERAWRSGERAVAHDPELAEAWVVLGMASMHAWRWERARAALEEAVALDPESAPARHRLGWLLAVTGDLEGGLAQVGRAAALDPLSLPVRNALGRVHEFRGRVDEATRQYRAALQLDPGSADAHCGLGTAFIKKGLHRDAVAALRRARDLADTPGLTVLLAFGHALAGEEDEARARLEEVLERTGRRHAPAATIGDVHLALGETDEGFAWYEEAYRQRSPTLMYLKVDPMWPPMREDPRWGDLLRRVRLDPGTPAPESPGAARGRGASG